MTQKNNHTNTIFRFPEEPAAWILENEKLIKNYLERCFRLFSEDDVHDTFMDLYLEAKKTSVKKTRMLS